MSASIVAAAVLLASVPAVRAEVTVELVPGQAGPYSGGESMTVDVWLHSEIATDEALSFIRFDFADTHAALSLAPTFDFDFSSIAPAPVIYDIRFTDLPLPWTANVALCMCPELFLWLPAMGMLHIGSIDVELPDEPGVYRLDLLNSDEADPTAGAMINIGTYWRAFTGQITGGTYEFVVGPPAIPTVSEWGMAAMLLLVLTAGTLVLTRWRPAVA